MCLATLVGFSRIYMSVHYPLDVVVGAVIGSVMAFVFFHVQKRMGTGFDRTMERVCNGISPVNIIRKRAFHFPLLLLIAGIVFFSGLGESSLWDDDEPRNAEAAREMLENGDWVVPYQNYELRTDKPAFLYWMMLISYSIFGVSEFSARFWAPVFGILTVLITYGFGRRCFGSRSAFLGGLILISSLIFNVSSRSAVPDAQMIFFINGALFAFFLGFMGDRRGWYYAFYASMGMAVLAKGPIGILLPSLAAGIYLAFKKEPFSFRRFRIVEGIGIGCVLVLPWFVAVIIKTHGAFFEGFFLQHNLYRYLNPMERHSGPLIYYFLVLLFACFPWSGLLPQMALHTHKDPGKGWEKEASTYLRWWIIVFILFFSIAKTKLPSYIIPILPALSLLIGRMLAKWLDQPNEVSRAAPVKAMAFNGFFGLVLFVGIIVGSSLFYPGKWPLAFIAFVPLFGAFLSGLLFHRGDYGNGIVVNGTMAAVFLILLAAVAIPVVETQRPIKAMSLITRTSSGSEEVKVATLKFYRPSMTFYCQRLVHRLRSIDEAKAFFEKAGSGRYYLFIRERYLKLLKGTTPLFILSEREGLSFSGKVFLVSNRPQKTEETRR
jgi:4-amino-4-deoxy-L-arabinose transferase-like glycosyltransferase